METAKAHAEDPITIGNRSVRTRTSWACSAARLDALPQVCPPVPARVPLGVYRGLRFGLALDPQFAPELYLEGAITRTSPLSREHHGPRPSSTPWNAWPAAIGPECERVQQDLAIAAIPAPRLQGPTRHTLPS